MPDSLFSGSLGYVKMSVPSWPIGVAALPWLVCDMILTYCVVKELGLKGGGGAVRGPSLALQLPDLADIQRDPAKCYFLNTLAFHNNLTTLLSFTSSLKRELDSFWLIYTDCIWKPSETEL